MRFFKLGVISVVFLFLLVTAMSLLLPSTINISRAVDINAPFNSIYTNVNDFSNWVKWYSNYDPSDIKLSNTRAGANASIAIHKTSITIISSHTDKITTLWKAGDKRFESEFNFFNKSGSKIVTVQWRFIQHVKWYPWEKFASIATDKTIGPVMEASLDNLKKLLEK